MKGEAPHIDNGIDEYEAGERARAVNSDEDESERDDSDSSESETENSDTGVIELLNRLSEDGGSDTEQPLNGQQPAMRLRGKGFASRFPYYTNVAVLLISCWILRLPVIYPDILR